MSNNAATYHIEAEEPRQRVGHHKARALLKFAALARRRVAHIGLCRGGLAQQR